MTRRITPTHTLIAQFTLGVDLAPVTFSNIPQNFTDLILVVSGAQTATTPNGGFLRFNSDSGTNYFWAQMTGSGTTVSSAGGSGNRFVDGLVYSNSITTQIVQILDYSSTDKHKMVLTRINTPDWGTRAYAGRWGSTSAVTDISIHLEAWPQFTTGSTFYLYGLVA